MDNQSFEEATSQSETAAGPTIDNSLQQISDDSLLVSTEPDDILGIGGPRPVKHRPTFTEEQISAMERIFAQRQYLSPMERESLAGSVGLTAQQVRVWFQNRRQKVKQFLTQRQIRNGGVSLQNGQKQGTTDSVSLSLNSQQLSTNIDPILQLLLPKSTENIVLEEVKDGIDKTIDGEVMEESVSSSTINLSPSQVSLTPYVLPLSGGGGVTPSIQLTTAQGGGTNITIPAIQLLQSLLSSSLPLGRITKTVSQSPNKAQGLSVPLKAQSPTRVNEIDEGTEIKSEEANTVGSLPPPSLDSKLSDQSPLQTDANPVLTAVSNEILQQLLGLTGEGMKTTLNLSVSPLQAIGPGGSPLDVPRRKRQVFSGIQTTELEKQFEMCAYIDSKERDKLADNVGLHPDQVKVWFQNRRTKRSRQSWRQQKSLSEQ